MRWLATCVPQAGHFGPLRPLLRALRDQGDEVLLASGPAAQPMAQEAGLAYASAGSDLDTWFGRLAARTRGMPGDGLPPERIMAYFVPRLFAEIGAADMVDDVLAAGRAFGADAVLFDTEAFCGPLVADLLGVPSVHHAFGALPGLEVQQLATDALSPLWRSFGRTVPDGAGLHRGPTVAVFPPGLDPAAGSFGDALLYIGAGSPVTVAAAPPTPPLVYLTLGTLWAEPTVLRTVLSALATEPVHVFATTGALEPAELGPLPDNASAARYRPQDETLPDAAVVVHHGGAGTMLGALAHGLPQVVLPQAADNFVNAGLVARCGAGVVLPPGEVTAGTVREAVRAVLADARYRDAATGIAAELRSLPSARDTATALRATISG